MVSQPRVVFYNSDVINLGIGAGEFWCCPLLSMRVDGKDTIFMGSYAANFRNVVPLTSDVQFEKHDGHLVSFGKLGRRFLEFLKLDKDMQTKGTSCQDFAHHFIAGFELKTHPNETFVLAVDQNVQVSELQPLTVVHMRVAAHPELFIHSALYLGEDLFLSKIGLNDVYVITNLNNLRQLYKWDMLTPMVKTSRCAGCGDCTLAPHDLIKCKDCTNAAYCTAECALKHKPRHAMYCKLQQNPLLLLTNYRAIYNDVQDVLAKQGAAPVTSVLLERLLAFTAEIPSPCTELQTLNWVAFPFEQDKTMFEWNFPHPSCSLCRYTLGLFTAETHRLILKLSAMRCICFVACDCKKWGTLVESCAKKPRNPVTLYNVKTGKQTTTRLLFEPVVTHKVRPWHAPVLPDSQTPADTILPPTLLKSHRHGTFQAPFLLKCNLNPKEGGFIAFDLVQQLEGKRNVCRMMYISQMTQT